MLKQPIKEIISRNLVSISPDKKSGEALRTMRDLSISCLPVIQAGKAAGILTERSLLKAVAERGEGFADLDVREIMSSPVVRVTGETLVYEAYNLLVARRLRHLVVTDIRGRPEGILSLTDIIDNMGMEYFLDSGRVAQVMSKTVVTVEPGQDLRECMRLMAESTISCLVVEEAGRPVGMFTERDAARQAADGAALSTPVGEVMSAPLKTVILNDPVGPALENMRSERIRRLVVLDGAGRLRGIITQSDIVRALESKYVALLREIIREGEERYKNFFDNASEGIFQTGTDGRILSANLAMADMLGFDSPEQMKAEVTDVGAQLYLNPDRRSQVVEELINQGGVTRVESEFLRRDGRTVWISYTMRAVRDQEGRILHYEGICTDVTDDKRSGERSRRYREELEAMVRGRTRELTEANARLVREIDERKKAEEEARKAKRRAESASEAKSAFLANMSHEIRTPIANIVGMTDFMLSSSMRREHGDKLMVVKQSASSLLSIVSDILDLSKIEAGKLEFILKDFSPARLLEKVAAAFDVRAKARGLNLSMHVAGDVPLMVRGDPDRLEQVLVNLVGNALKFTDQGYVRMGVAPEGEPGTLLFSVADTGMGIPEDKHEIIFHTFTQADSSLSRRFKGTGLGLAVSRELVGLMRGSIWVDSMPGRGSTFHFTARFDPPLEETGPEPVSAPPEPEEEAPPPAGALNVLLAEDNEVNQTFLSMFLEEAGHACTVVENGQKALDALERERFDLIVMDVQMPVMDGVTATRAIRKRTRGANPTTIPIIALTAYSMKGDRERFLAAGMNEYLPKPVDMDELVDTINRVMRAPT